MTCETAKEFARILEPLEGKSPYYAQTATDFIQQIKGIKQEKDECISLYDMKAPFSSVSKELAINFIKGQLEHERELHQRTS